LLWADGLEGLLKPAAPVAAAPRLRMAGVSANMQRIGMSLASRVMMLALLVGMLQPSTLGDLQPAGSGAARTGGSVHS